MTFVFQVKPQSHQIDEQLQYDSHRMTDYFDYFVHRVSFRSINGITT